jgi:ABC-type glycerol-3-phosphate transport system permease component
MIKQTLVYLALIIASIFALAPLAWGLSTSLKIPTEVSSWPPRWIPPTIYWGNYIEGFFTAKFLRYLANTFIVIGGAIIVSLTLAVHAAYIVSRRQFRGKNLLMFLVWATIMIPGVAVIVPLYLLAVDIGIYDTYGVLILVYSAWLIPTLIWLLKGFIDSVPVELEESALIDGTTYVGAFYRIVFPLLKPGLAAGSALVFLTIWNDFLIGYSLTLTDNHRLVQVGLYFFVTEVGISWGPLMAATMGSLIPVILVFALLQRAFIQGLTGGAVKG